MHKHFPHKQLSKETWSFECAHAVKLFEMHYAIAKNESEQVNLKFSELKNGDIRS